jgi:hypothetical protein
MKNIIGISAILAMVLFAGSALAACTLDTDCTTGTICVSGSCITGTRATVDVVGMVCGVSVTDGSPINFGTIISGPTTPVTSTKEMVTVTNGGNTATDTFTVAGTTWQGITISNTMPVTQTEVFDTGSCASGCQLQTTSQTIFNGVVPSLGSVIPGFTVTIPNAQSPDTYSQTITFTASCDEQIR